MAYQNGSAASAPWSAAGERNQSSRECQPGTGRRLPVRQCGIITCVAKFVRLLANINKFATWTARAKLPTSPDITSMLPPNMMPTRKTQH